MLQVTQQRHINPANRLVYTKEWRVMMKLPSNYTIACLILMGMSLAACSSSVSLDGTSWAMASYRDSQGYLVDILPDTIVTADFKGDQVSGNVTCNNFSGAYQTSGDEIKIGPLVTTTRMCIGPDGIMEQEAAFLIAFEAATKYAINGDTLEMVDAQGATILLFNRSVME